jgi:hypothetical protein
VLDAGAGDEEDDVLLDVLDGVEVVLEVLLVVVCDGDVVLDGVEEWVVVVELLVDLVLWAWDGGETGLLFEPDEAASAIATPTTIAASTAPANSQIRLGERRAAGGISAVGSGAGRARGG